MIRQDSAFPDDVGCGRAVLKLVNELHVMFRTDRFLDNYDARGIEARASQSCPGLVSPGHSARIVRWEESLSRNEANVIHPLIAEALHRQSHEMTQLVFGSPVSKRNLAG